MIERTMFYKAGPHVFDNARLLRKNLTHAEMLLWNYLRTKPNGYKFRRQHPLGIFIADFYCHRLKLVIELDGSIHHIKEVKEHDVYRQKLIEEDGINVIRFTNNEVQKTLEDVIKQIQSLLHD
jgi:imidazole glycerol-phosphate synthase subunit HisF